MTYDEQMEMLNRAEAHALRALRIGQAAKSRARITMAYTLALMLAFLGLGAALAVAQWWIALAAGGAVLVSFDGGRKSAIRMTILIEEGRRELAEAQRLQTMVKEDVA